MLLVAACSGISSTAAVLLAVNSIVDQQHRVRRERLMPRAPGSAGVANWIQAQVAKVPGCNPQLPRPALCLTPGLGQLSHSAASGMNVFGV